MIKKIKIGEKEIILVGTAHISKESINLVEKTIDEEQPDIIGIELDKERLAQLLSGKKWQETNIIEVVKTGKTYLFLLNLLLSNIQKQLGNQVGVTPGAEMLAAIKKAQETKKPIYLLDRDVRVTLKRTFSEMRFLEKLKLGGSLIGGFMGFGERVDAKKIEELKQQDLINHLMKELGREFPSMKKVLVDERDLYIAEMIKHSPGKKIVAIVGAGHLEGIEKHIMSKKNYDINKLNSIPKQKNYLKYVSLIVPILFFAILIYGFFTQGIETSINILFYWIIATGILSGIGALIARAHPFTILTSIVVAPLTTLHPALAAGWFAAIVETKYHPPLVKDFEELSTVESISGFYKNRITHILLVAALVNIGATIGVLIALPLIISLFA
ncbi:MAG: TraB/GumN family protein [Candidatus Diapherotrites archaeon]|jgi:pheromone shutdown-related protein TraB|uniref:TraB/GumN family protein n=1 Tax=Candidatus Iainarchaeum sp. TaxID=3101447 RepID=A0A7K4BYP9_9ARCH|nr:TraB/GumN family protein [Candidatus Diapherotrites archaeon]